MPAHAVCRANAIAVRLTGLAAALTVATKGESLDGQDIIAMHSRGAVRSCDQFRRCGRGTAACGLEREAGELLETV